jgi:hypothetical protein
MEAIGFEFTPAPEGKPYLGEMDVVGSLVNNFADRVLAIESAFRAGKPGFEDAQVKIEALAQENGDAIMGRNPAYTAAPWQTDERLGKVLRLTTPGIHCGDDSGPKFFEYLALELVKLNRAMERGTAPEEIGSRVRVLLDDAIAKILGLKGIPGEEHG